ncbi:ComF family protein [Patescibacteria group bacterium]|nr:ComF family protein [Patescibacteria group bacterium]
MGGFAAKACLVASEVVLPPICLVCRKRLAVPNDRRLWICGPCREEFKISSPYVFCSECGGRFSGGGADCHPRNCFPVFAPLDYDDRSVRDLVRTFKYGHGRIASRFLASVISRAFQEYGSMVGNSVLVPIPLHPGRERERGFNQSLVLAEALVRTPGPFCRLKVAPDVLFKNKSTPPQAKAESKEERAENIAGSFGVGKRPADGPIVIVDDVFTTGATMREAARTLKKSGGRVILGLAAARA